ncbi:MAG TPA: hypothetical protein VF120_15505 [Ktedonobacterales bacterium]
MSSDEHFNGHQGLAAFERQLKADTERLREEIAQIDLSDLSDEQRKLLLRLLALGAGLGAGALGLYLGKRAADGIAQSDLPRALEQLETLPREIVERIRAGWSGATTSRGRRIVIPED